MDLLAALRKTLPTGQEGQEPLLHLSIAQDGSHHLRGAHTSQVHFRVEGGKSDIIIASFRAS